MGFATYIDWSTELQDYEKWENRGRQQIEEDCNHKHPDDKEETYMRYSGYCEKCGYSEDSAIPMMNFGYPLETEPDDERVLEVIKKTNCTVMHNTNTDTQYIVLTGGGMNLSQDIALAYLILENWIPFDLATQVCTQPDLSVYGSDFRRVMRAVRRSLKKDIGHAQRQIKKSTESIKKSLQRTRDRKEE